MAILRDMTGNKTRGDRYFIRTCKYCTDFRGRSKPIMPDDLLARKEADGSYRCGVCVNEMIDNSIIKVNPNSEKARNILARRQREEAINRMNKLLYERSRAAIKK